MTLDHDTEKEIKKRLIMGHIQADIAEDLGVSEGTVSNRNQRLENGESFMHPEAYIQVRETFRELHKTGLTVADARETLEKIVVINQHGIDLDLHQIAEVVPAVRDAYSEKRDLHEVVLLIKELIAVIDEFGTELYFILDDPNDLRKEIQEEIPEPHRRTMSEARQYKIIKLLEMSDS